MPTTAERIMAHVLRGWAQLQSAKDFLRPREYSLNLVTKPDSVSLIVFEKPASRSSPDVSVSLEEEIPSSLSTEPIEAGRSGSLEFLLTKNIAADCTLFIVHGMLRLKDRARLFVLEHSNFGILVHESDMIKGISICKR